MKHILLAAMFVGLTVPAMAQSAKPSNAAALSFECKYEAGRDMAIYATNPNKVDKKCTLKCTYTASDKKSYQIECKNVGVFKEAKKLKVCGEGKPKGSAPYSNAKAEGTCT